MRTIWTVSKLNEVIGETLESEFDQLWVEGEVSNLRKPSSGHIYFTLKDQHSQIRAVIFRSTSAQAIRGGQGLHSLELQEGMKILCRARLSVYRERGEYQLIVASIEPLGIGALQIAFEQLKARLEKEGLFHAHHKRPLPFLPKTIGIATSPTGAVLRDILEITKRRFSSINIVVAPCRVQGAEAPTEIIEALEYLQTLPEVEVIILARGGGSLEDLAPYNDERVARAIFACKIPIVSAIGHETDFTIADFVADLRAPTPSAAAELVTPLKIELITRILELRKRLIFNFQGLIKKRREKCGHLFALLRDPRGPLAQKRFAVDDRLEKVKIIIKNRVTAGRQRLVNIELRLQHNSPLAAVRTDQRLVAELRKKLAAHTLALISLRKKSLERGLSLLNSLNPLAVLNRGYSIARSYPEGVVIKDAGILVVDSEVEVTVARGSFHANVTTINREITHE